MRLPRRQGGNAACFSGILQEHISYIRSTRGKCSAFRIRMEISHQHRAKDILGCVCIVNQFGWSWCHLRTEHQMAVMLSIVWSGSESYQDWIRILFSGHVEGTQTQARSSAEYPCRFCLRVPEFYRLSSSRLFRQDCRIGFHLGRVAVTSSYCAVTGDPCTSYVGNGFDVFAGPEK